MTGMDKPGNESWPDKGLWIYPKFFATFVLFILIDSGIGGLILLIALINYGWALLTTIGGVILGAWSIRFVVRTINRRRERELAKRPAEPP
jgi:hypothetical protein